MPTFGKKGVESVGVEGALMVLIHKECDEPALEESPVGEVCAIPIDCFPFSCFTRLVDILDKFKGRLSEELGI